MNMIWSLNSFPFKKVGHIGLDVFVRNEGIV